MNSALLSQLEAAWRARGDPANAKVMRVFHGPGEGEGALRDVAIDRFGDHAWVTVWERKGTLPVAVPRAEITQFLQGKGLRSAVLLDRPQQNVPSEPVVIFGQPPSGRFECQEGDLNFRIQLLHTRHPGLFLDHAPLRQWLRKNARGWRVLNTFAYTGSLSVACGKAGAAYVTTLDLSKPTIRWAEENWDANALPRDSARFIAGDAFDWLPRLRKKMERFDCIILDPPSFSRGPSGAFSTSQDLAALHELAFALLAPGGHLVTSINSANVTRTKFLSEIHTAAKASGLAKEDLLIVREITQPPDTFPALAPEKDKDEESRYLKGWIFRSPTK